MRPRPERRRPRRPLPERLPKRRPRRPLPEGLPEGGVRRPIPERLPGGDRAAVPAKYAGALGKGIMMRNAR